MSQLLQINLFSSKPNRYKFTEKMVDEIFKIKNKSDLKLCIYCEASNIDLWKEHLTKNKPPIKTELILFSDSSYTSKVDYAHRSNFTYSCKLDDDILMGSNAWDFIIDNLGSITPRNPVLAPIFTNGIPSADMFVDDFLSLEDREIAHNYFLQGGINENEWCLNFSDINRNISQMKSWSGEEYWNMVANVNTEWDTRPLPWYYYMVRGVHPARYSREYNLFIADRVIKNKDKFFGSQNYKLESYNAPYFCNNLFFSTTEFWRESYKLFHDGWDEGQLTLKMNLENSAPLYVRNGFAIHMAYGMTRGQQEIETFYINNI